MQIVPVGGFEPPSPPYERGARNHLRYTDKLSILLPLRYTLTYRDWYSYLTRPQPSIPSCFKLTVL